MFELNQNHLSNTQEVISIEYYKVYNGGEFNKVLKFGGVDLEIQFILDHNLCKMDVFLRSNSDDEYFCNPNITYNLVLKNCTNVKESLHQQIKINSEHKMFDVIFNDNYDDDDDDNDEYIKFMDKWLSFDDERTWYFTLHFWRQQDPQEEKRILELTDCVIDVQHKNNPEIDKIYHIHPTKNSYRANISVLAKSSQIIHNMIKDTEAQYSPQKPLNVSQFFENFSYRHVHMYLCCVYNPSFKFFELFDILEILKISIKLQNSGLIQRIMDMESLAEIVAQQTVQTDESNPCNIHNDLNFANKYELHNLTIFTELRYLLNKKQKAGRKFTGILKNFLDQYEQL